MRLLATGNDLPGVLKQSRIHHEGLLRIEAQRLLHRGHLVIAQRGAMRVTGVHLVRCRPADHGTQHDERGSTGLGLGRIKRFQDRDDVLAAVNGLNMPAVSLIASGGVLRQRDLGVVLDGDLVGVVHHHEIAELLGAGQ